MFLFFLKKEISDRYLGNSSALLWIIVYPLISLVIYNFVFGMLFKARVPELPQGSFIAYIAVGLWPWMAFSESVLNSLTGVIERKDLLGKVKLDLRQVVLAGTAATFLLHGIGFFVVLSLLILMGKVTFDLSLLMLIGPMILLFILAICLSLFFSALQVFFRDAQQIVSSVMPLWFFCTPIIYGWSLMPEGVKQVLAFNPLLPIINWTHNLVFGFDTAVFKSLIVLSAVMLVMLYLANAFFKKLAPRFDDFV